MSLEPQIDLNQQDKDTSNVPVGEFYIRAVGTNKNVKMPINESVSNKSTSQDKSFTNQPQSKEQKGNNNLNKVLLGGLLGATLGTLAAALANKKTAQGANLAAKGVGDAAKTVAEGIKQGLVSPVVDALKDTAEGAKKSLGSTADQLKQTAEYVNPNDQEFEPQTTYVLIPVEKERIIERTIIVEPSMSTESGESDFMPEELNQQNQDNYQTSQFNEQTSDYHE